MIVSFWRGLFVQVQVSKEQFSNTKEHIKICSFFMQFTMVILFLRTELQSTSYFKKMQKVPLWLSKFFLFRYWRWVGVRSTGFWDFFLPILGFFLKKNHNFLNNFNHFFAFLYQTLHFFAKREPNLMPITHLGVAYRKK